MATMRNFEVISDIFNVDKGKGKGKAVPVL
jgi:hypothetical protein